MIARFLLFVFIVTLSSCSETRNAINRALVKEGEPFTKYGVEGFPDGIEVYKGSECMMTPFEIKRHYKKVDRANELKRQERLDSIKKADEDLMNYIQKVTQAYQDTASY